MTSNRKQAPGNGDEKDYTLINYRREVIMSLEGVATARELSALEELTNMPLRGENPYVRKWKENGGLVFGYICSYVPEELLYAVSGRILPIRAGASGCTSTEEADVHLSRFHCTYPRCLLQLGLTGEYDFLDGFVFMNGCEQLRRVYEIWRKEVAPSFIAMVTAPHVTEGEERLQWYLDDIKRLIDKIAATYGLLPSTNNLKASIRHYNKYRKLLAELYGLRAREKPPLTGTEAMRITNAAFSMPKEVLNEKLEMALEELKQRPGVSACRARIMVAGSFMDDTFLIDLIESTGALVVTDNLCFGRRYIDGMVEEKGDPIRAIAERYFFHNPCPRMYGTYKERIEFTKKVAKEANVDGIIFQRIAFCDNFAVEAKMQTDDLTKEGIPTLILEREYMPSDEGRLKTRIQAFLEKMGK